MKRISANVLISIHPEIIGNHDFRRLEVLVHVIGAESVSNLEQSMLFFPEQPKFNIDYENQCLEVNVYFENYDSPS